MAKEKNKTELPQVMEGELQARLIKLREDAGFDLSQMADALCLSEDVIVNLENEAFELLPEPPYVRGYLRNYAKLGNVDDASELITRYEALRGADASELDFQVKSSSNISTIGKKRISPIWGQIILLGILVAAIALVASIPGVKTWVTGKWESFSSQLEPTDASNNPSLLGNLPVPTPLPEDVAAAGINNNQQNTSATTSTTNTPNTDNDTAASTGTDAQSTGSEASNAAVTDTATTENNRTSTENTSSATETSTTETATQTQTDTPETATSTTDAQEIATASLDGSINIKLVFNEEVWLRIKDKDNKTVFEGLNKADTEKTIELVKPLTFRVGNAQGLSLFIDNKAVDISTYINGSIANFTLE